MNTCCVYRRKISHLKLILRTAFLVILLLTIYLLHNSLHTTYNSPFSINNQAYLLNNYTYIVTKEELEFPLAFSLIIYRDYDRAYRLIQIIYRPHNFYCIHIDKKSSEIDYQKFRQLIFQFNKTNIYFIADAERVNVQWGRYSVLEADLKCAQLLLLSCCGKKKKANKWKYFINLTGHEFPLRTNWELVKALKLLNGLNIAPAHWLQTKPWRIPPKHLVPLNVNCDFLVHLL
ncbi:unnamed protein product [Schistosoma turkestanicum]|nr:unnamed protein product [Schistosoma turkestanicum]